MKRLFSKLAVISISMMAIVFTSCDNNKHKGFSVTVKEAGPEYVEVIVHGGEVIRMAYIVDSKEQLMNNPQQLFKKGTEVTVKGGEVLRISQGLKEETQYYLYACAALSETTFSEILVVPFKTTQYNLSELLTVVDQYYDGYKMRITVPEETKERGNAIRYNQSCIMMYNYMKASRDDYFSLLYNAGAYAVNDSTILYTADENWFQTETDSDGDGELDWDTRYNPISPGEPVVFIAGEFAWMEDTPEYKNEYFPFPAGWVSGYYLPMLDTEYYKSGTKSQESMGEVAWDYTHPMDEYWSVFQRRHFLIKQPSLLDAGVEVKLANVTPINATLEFYPEEGVEQYAFGIFDEDMYREQILPLLNGNEDYMQWAVTSYFSAYTFGTKVAAGAVQVDLTSFYYQEAITPETNYILFLTAMGDSNGTSQSFQTFKFSTTAKVLDAPEVKVTPIVNDEGQAISPSTGELTPYTSSFNIKCTTYESNPLMLAYYAVNYLRDWKLAINGGSTYFSILNGNNAFTAEELSKINSAEGLTISIPSVDGEITRLAVLGYNTEYTPNDVTSFKDISECPAVADVTTSYAPMKNAVNTKHYAGLVGDWTATATLQKGSDSKKLFTHKSKITISDKIAGYPETLPADVYSLYEEVADKDRDEVDTYYQQFKEKAEEFTFNRLKTQNRLLCTGWMNVDSYNRLNTRTPYDLFIAKDYTSVDVSSIFYDFGPKWYIEAVQDEDGNVSLIAPVDQNFLPPTANWTVPFYMSGMEPKNYYTVTYAADGKLSFPVEYDAEKDQITIKPFLYNEVEYYPNVIGMDPNFGVILENPVVSEIVLTRGWTEETKAQSSVMSSGESVQVHTDLPRVTYKSRTEFKEPVELKKIKMEPVTVEKFRERADKYVENYFNLNK